MPKFLHSCLESGFPFPIEKIVSFYISQVEFLNWQAEHAKWVFCADGMNTVIKKCTEFNEEISYEKLTTDSLVLVAKNDNYYNYSLAQIFFERIPTKKQKNYNKET